MSDAECVEFLRWALPRLGMRWPGFRRVRRQVCRRLARRVRALGLDDLAAYRRLLGVRPAEWEVLDGLCRIPISRFLRDRGVWDALAQQVLPDLASRGGALRAWSAGCASGEEPYSLAILWELVLVQSSDEAALAIVGTDADPYLVERARRGVFGESSLREVPAALREAAFERDGAGFRVREPVRRRVTFLCQDLRRSAPDGRFELVLCRNLAFTYFDAPTRDRVLARLAAHTAPGGALVIGAHEALPPGAAGFEPWRGARGVHRRVTGRAR